ncbi:hypothetical protein LCGC14_1976900 [marine sediment metagenome]|uniref:Uncharacterized protein n=1 Tax=marine sediment metagenome TaxID=412755 RepID=A0A0F9I735_9ZZZZ
MRALDVPLARSWEELLELPAVLVQDYLIMKTAIVDAEAWKRLDDERNSSG